MNLGKVVLKSLKVVTPGQIYSSGAPSRLKIFIIQSISESEGNKGLFVYISAIMQPMLQISTPIEYSFFPSRTSGARNHKVSISWDKVAIGSSKVLANPKSQIFNL